MACISLFVVGCTASEDPTSPPTEEPAETPTAEPAAEPASPEQPTNPTTTSSWANQPVPFVAYYNDVTVAFKLTQPTAVDAIVGLADGKVESAADLGPSLRLGADGTLQAIDGAGYRADAAVAYTGAALDVVMRIDLERHRYSVEVNGAALATDYAFAASQAELSRLDTFATRVETANTALAVTELDVGPKWCHVAGQAWVNLYHPSHSGKYRVQFEAQVPAELGDAVIGLASTDVSTPAQLAGALQFSANDQLQVRDGETYRADATYRYAADTYYTVTLEVDVPNGTYSVATEGSSIATSYALTGGANALTQLGMYASEGYVRVCDLTVWDY